MKIYRCLGYAPYSFDRDGRTYSGTTFYFATDLGERGRGECSEKVSVNSAYAGYRPEIGEECYLLYNRYGKVDCFVSADSGVF